MPIHGMSPHIKSGSLVHKTVPPPPSPDPTESICCIPQQAVESAFQVSSPKVGRFLVLYRCTAIFDTSVRTANTGLWQRWDIFKGWEFELTTAGTIKYRGPYRAISLDTEREWTQDSGKIFKLEEPAATTFNPSPYRFVLYGGGDHVAATSTLYGAAGHGTWSRLVHTSQSPRRRTHALYIALPELIAHIIACGVAPKDVPGSLQQGPWGYVVLGFTATAGRKGPESFRSGRDMKPKEAWKEGWWYTWRPGMEVWVC